MIIEKIKVEQLIPADYNPRKDLQPGDSEYEKIKRSLEEFGYVDPSHLEQDNWKSSWWTSTIKSSSKYGKN